MSTEIPGTMRDDVSSFLMGIDVFFLDVDRCRKNSVLCRRFTMIVKLNYLDRLLFPLLKLCHAFAHIYLSQQNTTTTLHIITWLLSFTSNNAKTDDKSQFEIMTLTPSKRTSKPFNTMSQADASTSLRHHETPLCHPLHNTSSQEHPPPSPLFDSCALCRRLRFYF